MSHQKLKIVVAMSGGVDSSVAAALLRNEGHDVIGVTLRLLPNGGEGFGCCGSPEDIGIARRSAEKGGFPHYVLDYSADFKTDVVDYFVNSYISGETPNPCLACNKHIKFDRLRSFARSVDATHLATGHYARIESSPDSDGRTRYRLFESVDSSKDQSYVLYTLQQDALSSILFPVGGRPKSEIREVARGLGLPNADKEDSQEICFVPNRDYRSFVAGKLKNDTAFLPATAKPGPIVDKTGRVLGEHDGVAFYTVGQRKGLRVPGTEPRYVTQVIPEKNTLVIGSDREGFSPGLRATNTTWVQGAPPDSSFSGLVKIRYKHEPVPATIDVNGCDFQVRFDEPQRAVTPGQAAVVYRWDADHRAREVLGGGKIAAAIED